MTLDHSLLAALLDGSTRANARMPWNQPGPILLPGDPTERDALIEAHITGKPATLTYCPASEPPRPVHVQQVQLSGLCPGADGLVRWVAVDLDHAAGHGANGLADPAHAARCLAERADYLGLTPGLIVATSTNGAGRHLWLRLPAPVTLRDAALALAYWVSTAYRIASRDREESEIAHAFRRLDDSIASAGSSGAVELRPHSDTAPPHGWPLVLPCSAIAAERGGGKFIDPFTDGPMTLATVPQVPADAWSNLLSEARAAAPKPTPPRTPTPRHVRPRRELLDRIDARTREFIDGRTPEGSRNQACFGAACNLLGHGAPYAEVEALILAGARGCGLPAQEARRALDSARKAVQQ